MRIRLRAAWLLAVPAAFFVACGGGASSEPIPVPTADNGLAGHYVAADLSTAPFASITFVDDTRYLLQPVDCPTDQTCREQGWYTVSGNELSLHDDLGDAAQTYPIGVLSMGKVPASVAAATDSNITITVNDETDSLLPLDTTNAAGILAAADAGTDAGDDGGTVVGSGGLVSSGSTDPLIDPSQVFALAIGAGGAGGASGSPFNLTNSAGQTVTPQNAAATLPSAPSSGSSGASGTSGTDSSGSSGNAANPTLPSSGATSGALVTPSNGPLVGSSILFEGSCSFLHSCSSFSKKLPAGEVSWGCAGVQVCSDTAHWLAGPSRAYCNKTVTVCKGSSCTTGKVLDVSNANSWEGSEGLLGAIGLPYSITGTCSGTGGGQVTIKD